VNGPVVVSADLSAVRRTVFLFVAALSLLPGCTKDYPNDIPGWVEDRIERCKEPFRDCNGLSIQEYSGSGQRWFYFREEDGSDELYTGEATLMCTGTNMFVDEEQCTVVVLDSLHHVRTIWVEG
jgi:hypothetical protein